jgi:hypothetical protein
MWGDKKPEAPGKKAVPQQPQPSQQAQQTKPTVPSANAPAFPGEAKTMAPNDATYPNTSSGNTARLGSSLHVKGEITGNEDLLIDGTVEGNLRARDRIEIKKDGSVVGDLTTARISIEDGAYFKGSIEIDKTGDAADDSSKAFSRANRGAAATTTS